MLTPRVKFGSKWYRVSLQVSTEDEAKIKRGPGWSAEVTEDGGIGDGRKWLIKAASCGTKSCYCDAVAIEQKKKPTKRK